MALIDVWGMGCGPNRMSAPVYAKTAAAHPDIVVGKVDTEAEQALVAAAAAQITSIPTLMAFTVRTLVFSQPGALPAPGLEEAMTAVRDLAIEAAQDEQKRSA